MPLLPTLNVDSASSLECRMHGNKHILSDTWSHPRKPRAIPVPVHDPPAHRAPHILCPTPIRSSSLDPALLPPYTPLPLSLDRPTAPVGGLSSCSPHYRREHAVIPLISGPVLIPSLASCGDVDNLRTPRNGWRPAQLDIASLGLNSRAVEQRDREIGRHGAERAVPGTPKTAGAMSHMRWASLPCALPSVQPMTAGVGGLHWQRSRPLLQGRDYGSGQVQAAERQLGLSGQAGTSAGHSAATAMRTRAPSIDDPRDRFQAWSFAPNPQKSTPTYAHARGGSLSEAPRGQSLVSGHKRSLSEKLKRLIIPTLPIQRERYRHAAEAHSKDLDIDMNEAASGACSHPIDYTAPAVSRRPNTAVGTSSRTSNANEKSQPRDKISTDRLHLQVDVRAPDRPYRSPGTASFMVRRGWPDHALQEADARDHVGAGRKISVSEEAQAYVSVQQQKRRESDDAIWRYEAAVRGLDEDEYEHGYEKEKEEGAGDYAKRASDATFEPGTSRGLLAPNATNVRGSCKDEEIDEGDGIRYALQEQDEPDECASRASTRAAELIENLLGDKPPSVSESEAYTSSDDSFGTSPVTRLGNDLHCDVVLN